MHIILSRETLPKYGLLKLWWLERANRSYPSNCRIVTPDVAPDFDSEVAPDVLPTSISSFVFLKVAFLSSNLGQLIWPINCYMSGKTDACLEHKPKKGSIDLYDQPEYWKKSLLSVSTNKNGEDRQRYFRTEANAIWNDPYPTLNIQYWTRVQYIHTNLQSVIWPWVVESRL